MDEWKLPWEGGCRCGAVRIRVTKPPLLAMACHCTGCQRMSASAFSLTLTLPADGFAVTRGEPVIGGLQGDDVAPFPLPGLQELDVHPGRRHRLDRQSAADDARRP